MLLVCSIFITFFVLLIFLVSSHTPRSILFFSSFIPSILLIIELGVVSNFVYFPESALGCLLCRKCDSHFTPLLQKFNASLSPLEVYYILSSGEKREQYQGAISLAALQYEGIISFFIFPPSYLPPLLPLFFLPILSFVYLVLLRY